MFGKITVSLPREAFQSAATKKFLQNLPEGVKYIAETTEKPGKLVFNKAKVQPKTTVEAIFLPLPTKGDDVYETISRATGRRYFNFDHRDSWETKNMFEPTVSKSVIKNHINKKSTPPDPASLSSRHRPLRSPIEKQIARRTVDKFYGGKGNDKDGISVKFNRMMHKLLDYLGGETAKKAVNTQSKK